MNSTSILDVQVNDLPTLRSMITADHAKQLEIWEHTQTRLVKDVNRQVVDNLADKLDNLAKAFLVTGNATVANRLSEIASEIHNLKKF